MLKEPEVPQQEMELVTIEWLVPEDHLLRKIDRAVDLEFVRDRVRHLYCEDNGRPALDPVVLFKLLLIGYLFGIRSERQLMREVQCNAAYRWYLRLKLTDKVPDASTLSQNRRRRFRDSDVYQKLFDEVVELAMNRGLVTGEVLYSDATHLKANANKNKFDVVQVEVKPQQYLAQLEEAIEQDRAAEGKRELKAARSGPKKKEIKVSRTDQDAGYMVREGKPKGFFYLDHRTVDGRHAIITDTYATPATVHDSVPYLGRLDRQRERFGFGVQAVGLDAGYATTAIAKGLEERGIYGVTGYRRLNHGAGLFSKRKFHYDADQDVYVCPNGQRLRYRTTNREGYRQYHSDARQCRDCPLRLQCTRSRNMVKVVTRHVWQEARDRVDSHRLEARGRKIYERRKETVERSFADAKQLHGHRYARMRGLGNVREQCLLAAMAQNIKKIALLLSSGGPNLTPEQRLFLLHRFLIFASRLLVLGNFYPTAPKIMAKATPPKSGGVRQQSGRSACSSLFFDPE